MKIIATLVMYFILVQCHAQLDSVVQIPQLSGLKLSAYAEVYYTYDFNKPPDGNRPAFFYNYTRHNEFNLNLAYVKATYNNSLVHANLSLAAGTYMNANYAAEPGTLKNVYEANAGIKLGKQNLWLDAGIFPSHIGFESAVSKDCWTLTRSIAAENTPYYEAGARLTFTTKNEKWLFAVMALNGWQRITRINGNSMISLGTQVQYKPTSRTTLNYSTFTGTDQPDSNRLIRYYHNLYGIFNVNKQLDFTAGFDIGFQQKLKGSTDYNVLLSPVVIAKYKLNDRWDLAGRFEYYSDRNNVLIKTASSGGFNTMGYSANLDYNPLPNAMIRFEIRNLQSNDPLFLKGTYFSKNDCFITTTFAVAF